MVVILTPIVLMVVGIPGVTFSQGFLTSGFLPAPKQNDRHGGDGDMWRFFGGGGIDHQKLRFFLPTTLTHFVGS